jgi:hypothetical protein
MGRISHPQTGAGKEEVENMNKYCFFCELEFGKCKECKKCKNKQIENNNINDPTLYLQQFEVPEAVGGLA